MTERRHGNAGEAGPGPLPPPPGGKPSWGVWLYGLFGGAIVSLYLLVGLLGWTWPSEQRSALPGSVRQAPGGYRGYTFWHTGYHGGK